WPKQAALAFGLSALTVVPMLLLQSGQPEITMAVAPTPDLVIVAPDAESMETETVVYQEAVDAIDMPDPL
ncbi:MAG: hypothetical protein PHH11_14090, partial [Methylomonas sp.]|nr:hypothetical protein [Methylomonas sp.]